MAAKEAAKYGCAVLAGGAGRRMGGVNKALLAAGQSVSAIDDAAQTATAAERPQTILERTAEILHGTGMPCYLSVAAYELDVPDGWTVVPDAEYLCEVCSLPGEEGGAVAGPLGGIYACLCKAAEDGLGGLFFVPCDAPCFEADLIENMLPHIAQKSAPPGGAESGLPDAVIWKTADGRQQTAFGWYSVSCLPVLRAQLTAGHYKVREALAKLQVKELQAAEEGVPEERFRNLNTPADLAELQNC